MIKEEIKVFEDTLTLSKGFTEFLQKLLEVYPHVNLSLSGGSTPKVLFDYWAKNCRNTIDWKRISFYWGDERCVTPEDEMSNYGMTKHHLFDKVPEIPDNNVHRIHGENESHEEVIWYSRVMARHLPKRKDVPMFEIVMLGLGDDGHTVSIFPNQMNLWDNEEDCVIAQHPESGMERISLTGRVVNNAQHVVFLATGRNKAEKVKEIISDRDNLKDLYPAARVNPKYGYLYWFLDKEAASLL